MIGLRRAVAQDTKQIIALWQVVFGDDAQTVARCLEEFAGPGHVFVAEEAGVVLAHLLAVPCTAGDAKGAYLYALATRPQNRGQGLMSDLMAFAEEALRQDGGSFAILNPASDSLFDFYRRRGYGDIDMRLLERRAGAMSSADITVGRLSASEFLTLRREYFQKSYPALVPALFSRSRTALILEDLWVEGYQAAVGRGGYALFKADEKPFVAELAADEAAAEEILAVIQGAGRNAVTLTLPAQGGPWPDEGRPFGEAQVKWLVDAGEEAASFHQTRPPLYLRFALDEAHGRLAQRGLL